MAIETFQSPINLQLAQTPQTLNPELYRELAIVYNAIRVLQQGVTVLTGAVQADPSTWQLQQATDTLLMGNLGRFYCQAGEDIGYGQLIRLVDNGVGGVAAVKADASNLVLAAEGYCNVGVGLLTSEFGEFIMGRGLLTGLAGLTPGQRYWLSLTAGNITNLKPTAAGQIGQYIGTAISDTQLMVNIGSALVATAAQY